MGKTVFYTTISIGGTSMVLNDIIPEFGMYGLSNLKGTTFVINLYLKDAKKSYKQAIEAGCQKMTSTDDMFRGKRMGIVLGPYGYIWSISQVIEEVSSEKLEKRTEKFFK